MVFFCWILFVFVLVRCIRLGWIIYTDSFYVDVVVSSSFYVFIWCGGHSGGVTPGLVSIPEVKSSCVFGCTVG